MTTNNNNNDNDDDDNNENGFDSSGLFSRGDQHACTRWTRLGARKKNNNDNDKDEDDKRPALIALDSSAEGTSIVCI